MKLDTILVPTDFSERANTALTHACDLAKLSGAALHVLHVLEWHANPTPSFGLGLALPTWVQESKTAAEHTLQQLIGKLCPDGQKVVPALLAGTPAKAVLSYATEHQTDLIVMTTHGRTGLAHALMGSVAESVLRTAPCPVLVVRTE